MKSPKLEIERPGGLDRHCLREMQMEHHIRERLGGQPYLPMWLPEYPPIEPRLTTRARRSRRSVNHPL